VGAAVSKRKARPTDPAAQAIDAAALAAERATAKREAHARASNKALADRVLELEASLAFMHSAPAHPPVIKTPSARPKSGKRIATPVFLWSDWHYGETVTREESLGRNEYDMAEADRRASKLFDNCLWLRNDFARANGTCDDTLLVIDGDMVTGDIHDELRETNQPGGLRAQADRCLGALLTGVAAMADATPGVLHVVCIGGNHGRLTKKQQIKNGTWHSAEHIGIYDPLRRLLGDRKGKIAWHIPPAERHIIEVHGRRVSTQHGTMIRSQGGIGGTLVPMTRWVTRANDADLYLFGHFHEADAYRNIIKNGSLIGPSAYTAWLGIEDRGPEQVAFVLDADKGVRRFERVSVT
jgi:hypothetical protein